MTADRDRLKQWWSAHSPADRVALIDPWVERSAPPRLRRILEKVPPERRWVLPASSSPVSLVEVEYWQARVADRAVVAIGGGRVMDAAKLAASGAEHLRLTHQHSGGLGTAVATTTPSPLLAVPTTVGTGAEVSAEAVAETGVGRMLLTGPTLRPGTTWYVPEVLGTLLRAALRTAGAEIIGRLLGPHLGSGDVPALHFDLARRVPAVIDDILRADTGWSAPAAELFAISARAHELCDGWTGAPQSYWLWPVATELSHLRGVATTDALLALLPPWLHWAASAHAGAIPARWFAGLLRAWGLPTAQQRTLQAGVCPTELLDRVDRWWRPVGPGIPPRDALVAALQPHDLSASR